MQERIFHEPPLIGSCMPAAHGKAHEVLYRHPLHDAPAASSQWWPRWEEGQCNGVVRVPIPSSQRPPRRRSQSRYQTRRLHQTVTLGFAETEFAIATYGLQHHSTPLPKSTFPKSSLFLHVGPYAHDNSSTASPRCHPLKQVTTNIATFYSTCVFNFTIINIP
jgi:hypothetical protein